MAKVKAVTKKSSKKDAVFLLLQKAGAKGVKVKELIKKCGKRAPARIYDIRADGHKVTTEPSRGPSCKYVLVGKKAATTKKPKGAKHGKKST